ncbi:hypothetical protein [Campylobacter sp.]|nr:hypothetical protein [Campylobacter sp.]MDO4673870.1 hypothetical protein [Campylobacter sp.]
MRDWAGISQGLRRKARTRRILEARWVGTREEFWRPRGAGRSRGLGRWV